MEENPQFLFQRNEHYHAVDALPYIDAMPAEAQIEVKRLIEEEMRVMEKRDYLAPLPLPRTTLLETNKQEDSEMKSVEHSADSSSDDEDSGWQKSVLRNEMERIAAGQPMERFQDVCKFEAIAPVGSKAKDRGEWDMAIKDAQTQVEHNTVRISNLELSTKYAQKAWLKHLADLEAQATGCKAKVTDIRRKIEEINKRRKLDQVSCGNDLRSAQKEWEELVESNAEITKAIISMR